MDRAAHWQGTPLWICCAANLSIQAIATRYIWLLISVAHEVNHIVNNDSVAPTAEYFFEEYRAYYVGFVAENGRPPTRDEIVDRVRGLITATTGAYGRIGQALADPTEGPIMVAFLQQVLGRN